MPFRISKNMRILLEGAVIACVVLLIPLPVNAQLRHGSIAVFGASQKRIVVAADSRGSLPDESQPDDQTCKISSLGRKLLFVETGISSVDRGSRASLIWSQSEEALRAFRYASRLRTVSPESPDIDQVTDKWIELMKARLLEEEKEHSLGRPASMKQVLLESVFAGLMPDGKLTLRQINMKLVGPGAEEMGLDPIVAHEQRWLLTEKNEFLPLGKDEIIREFYAQKTDRMKREAVDRKLEVHVHPPADLLVAEVAYLVGLTIKYAPKEYGVGGDIDVAEITPEKGVHWISRKPVCPEDSRAAQLK
jgi:hypothetical protein